MPRQTRLATCIHEAGHAIVQLAHSSHPWIDSIAVDDLPEGLLGLVDTVSTWQPSILGMAAGRDVHEAWSAAAWRDVVNYLAGPSPSCDGAGTAARRSGSVRTRWRSGA